MLLFSLYTIALHINALKEQIYDENTFKKN